MWAMIPMLRTRASGTSRISGPPLPLTSFSATAMALTLSLSARPPGAVFLRCGDVGSRRGQRAGSGRPSAVPRVRGGPIARLRGPTRRGARHSPPVVGERLVGLRHLLQVVLAFDGGSEPIARVQQLR